MGQEEGITRQQIKRKLLDFGFGMTGPGEYRRMSELRDKYVIFNGDAVTVRTSHGTQTATISTTIGGEYAEAFPSVEIMECGDGKKLVFRSDEMKTVIEIYQFE